VEPGSSYYGYTDDPSIRYFNGTPAACVLWGGNNISKAADFFEDGKIDLVVSGPNDGPNLGAFVYSLSGTCGAAFAGVTLGIPSIATSAYNFTHRSYKDIDYNNPYDSSLLAANLVANLVSSLADGYDKSSGEPLFPLGIGLNVNLPELSQNCSAPEFHLTRLAGGAFSDDFVLDEDGFPVYVDVLGPGVNQCHYGDCSLPGETTIVENHCASAISVFDADYDAGVKWAGPIQEHIRTYLAPVANKRVKRSLGESLRRRKAF